MDIDITWPMAEYAGHPPDEQPLRLAGLDDCTPAELTERFVLLTGTAPISPGATADPAGTKR